VDLVPSRAVVHKVVRARPKRNVAIKRSSGNAEHLWIAFVRGVGVRAARTAKMTAHVLCGLERGERFTSFDHDGFRSESGPGSKGAATQVATLATVAIHNAFWVRTELQLHCATEATSGLGDDLRSAHGIVSDA